MIGVDTKTIKIRIIRQLLKNGPTPHRDLPKMAPDLRRLIISEMMRDSDITENDGFIELFRNVQNGRNAAN